MDPNIVHTILADNEFQALRDDAEDLGITVNTVAKDEHIPEVERQNRVIKERVWAIIQTLPYQRIPKKMWIAMIHYVVYWLNYILKVSYLENKGWTTKQCVDCPLDHMSRCIMKCHKRIQWNQGLREL